MGVVKDWWQRARQAGWRARVLYGVLGLLVGGLLLWSGLNLMHAAPPEPLWTEDDLPRAPPPEQNGWHVLTSHATEIRRAPSQHVGKAVRAWLAVEDGLEPPDDPSVALADEEFATPEARAAWERCAAGLAKPTFADDCPIDFEAQCPALEIAGCHRLASFVVVRHVVGGQWSKAVQLLEPLVRQDMDHVATARSVVGTMVALYDLRDGFALSAWFVARARDADQHEAVQPLSRRVESFVPADVDFTPVVVAEYLLDQRGLRIIASGEADAPGLGLPGFFLDEGATAAELNRIYASAHLRAGAVRRPTYPSQPYAAGFGWWLINPLGKLFLDAVLPPERVFDSLAKAREEVLVQHRTLQKLLSTE